MLYTFKNKKNLTFIYRIYGIIIIYIYYNQYSVSKQCINKFKEDGKPQ